jgi:hypothetical protein
MADVIGLAFAQAAEKLLQAHQITRRERREAAQQAQLKILGAAITRIIDPPPWPWGPSYIEQLISRRQD